MKRTLLLITAVIVIKFTYAQNWLTTGNTGTNATNNFLGTIDNKAFVLRTNSLERGRIQANGTWKFGVNTNNATIDSTGVLKFSGTGAYQVGDDKYVFQNSSHTKYGLFFNGTIGQYEFRDSFANIVFSVNDHGNGMFPGTLKIGAYTLPNTDGTSGQLLTTNGSGVISWANASGGGANTALSNLTTTAINQSLIPASDSAFDLGNKIKRWRNAFVAGKIGVGVDPVAKVDIRGVGTGSGTYSLRVTNLLQFGLVNTLFSVRDDGRVGIGTSNPTSALHVVGDAIFNTTNTDCDLRQKTNFTDMGWFASGSSNKMGLYNYASSKTLMKVFGTGEVCIGGEPDSNMELSLNAAPGNIKNLFNDFRIYTNQKYWDFSTYIYEDVVNNLLLFTKDGGGGEFDYTTGIYTAHINPLKNPAEKIDYPLIEKVNKLQAKMISYANTNKEYKSYGFDVNDLIKLFPNTVYTSKNPKTGETLYGINYDEFSVIAIKAIQEQQQQLDDIKKQNEILANKNNELEQRLSRLEALMSAQQSGSQSQLQKTISLSNASIEQNIPNPFNHTTIINYTLPQQYASAKIIVVDKAGKALKEINLQGFSNSAKGSLKIDASTLSSGAYNYSLYVDGRLIDTKQMILAK